MANVTFSFDGVDFSNLLFVNNVGRDLIINQIVKSTDTNTNGELFINKRDGIATVPVDVVVYEDSLTALHRLKRDIASKLIKAEPKALIFSDESDKYLNAILSGNTSLDLIALNGTGTLNFMAFDPYWYAVEDETFNFNGTGNHNFTRSKGNINSLPKIEVTAVGSGTIEIILNGVTINYTGTMVSGDKLVIDSKLKTAYILNGEVKTSAINNLDSLDFFEAVTGENSFYVLTSDFTVDIDVTCRSRWV